MEQITANLSGKVRRATIAGREHLVAPMTLIVPGVLNGSQGPLFYPIEEIAKDSSIWNNVPIVIRHPQKDGRNVSARSPQVIDKQGVGRIFNAKVNGKLTAEGWFEVESLTRVAPSMLDALESSQVVELSTGLFTDNKPAPAGSNHEGKSYSSTAYNYRPDHLAILPDELGACSVDDGCGVNVNEGSENLKSVTNTSLTEREIEMAKINDEARKKVIDGLIANECCYEEEDREALNSLSDDALNRFESQAKLDKEYQLVANAATEGFKDQQGNSHKYIAETAKWEMTEVKKKEPVVNKPSDPPKKPTEEEWLAGAPASVQEDLAFARNEKSRQKTALIERLVANVKDETFRKRQAERLSIRSLTDLQADVALLPEPKKEDKLSANYYGASAPADATPAESIDKTDILQMPTINWAQEQEAEKQA